MDASQFSKPQCLGPWTQPIDVSSKKGFSPIALVHGKSVSKMRGVAQLAGAAKGCISQPEEYLKQLQSMKVEVCQHFVGCDAGVGSNASSLNQTLGDLAQASLLKLTDEERSDFQKVALKAEGFIASNEAGAKPDKSKATKMTSEKLSALFDALTTNPYQPEIMQRLAIDKPEIFVKLLQQADHSALTGSEFAAIYRGCQAYMNKGEGRDCIEVTPQACDYARTHKRLLPEIPDECFEVKGGVLNQFQYQYTAHVPGGTDKVEAELPEDFDFQPGEDYVAFDYGNQDHRCMKVLNTALAQCHGAMVTMKHHMVSLEQEVPPKYKDVFPEQKKWLDLMTKDFSDLSVLLGQAYMLENLREYHNKGSYKRVIYVEPGSACLASGGGAPDTSEVFINFDTYHPRVPESEGGPWKGGQPKFQIGSNWPAVDLTNGFCWTEKDCKTALKQLANKSTFFSDTSSGSESDSGIES